MINSYAEFQNKVFEFNENVYEGVWDQEVYYQLESFIINYAIENIDNDMIPVIIARSFDIFSSCIYLMFASTINPTDVYEVIDASEDQVRSYYERFQVVDNIFWGNYNYSDYGEFLRSNPYLQ